MISPWPVCRTYTGAHLRRIALPLGGIGTGTISLGGRGNLTSFEVVNRPAFGFVPPHTFLAIRVEGASGVFARLLEGPIPPEDYEGSAGSRVPNHGLPRFAEAEFDAAYPLARVRLTDADCPATVAIEAFSPFVPGDVEASAFPVAVLRVRVTNPGPAPLRVSLMASLTNFIGTDGVDGKPEGAVNETADSDGLAGVRLSSSTVPASSPMSGTLAIAALEPAGEVTRRTALADRNWGNALLDYWDDFARDGALDPAEGGPPVAAVCVRGELAAGAELTQTFLIGWHFPNRLTWTPGGGAKFIEPGGANPVGDPIIGNAYAARFDDAWDAVARCAAGLSALEARTMDFARAFYGSDLPDVIREAAGFNLSTLRSGTVFQAGDGHFYAWEGVHDQYGSCFGNCTHVWNYEQATAFLFPEIARDFRATEFGPMLGGDGHMAFRVGLPTEQCARWWNLAAADGQMGCLMKLYRDWRLCGDTAWLRTLWPAARRALEFCWVPGGWDGDQDGVMEGCQHNTMDVEYYGPNPQMQSWYLGALRAGEEMAGALGEGEFAARCRALFEAGSRWTDAHLFNGEYYEQQVRPATLDVAPGLRWHPFAGDPPLQLGSGCLIDQLVGDYMAEVCGLGDLLDPDHVRRTLDAILTHNRRTAASPNHMRSYALGDEAAVLMASYPRGGRPEQPFPYYPEAMTGFEHMLAAQLLFKGETERGLDVARNVRARYDGRKRNPFDEAECGRHYGRAMAAWAQVLAFTGFAWDGLTGTMRLRASDTDATWFWSVGSAWGTFDQRLDDRGHVVRLNVRGGSLPLRTLAVAGYAETAVAVGEEVVLTRR